MGPDPTAIDRRSSDTIGPDRRGAGSGGTVTDKAGKACDWMRPDMGAGRWGFKPPDWRSGRRDERLIDRPVTRDDWTGAAGEV
ncbi:hypothetical protein chiPu_0020621 [Chiloscyllium punctatum]|uniref:Uncharacterized protein n=1 Tax=Chiloscyllium punctatum TaxID=137246 RepID=A0A401RHM0_CHIPU|nr:hypothetical protein [Chiloscyllium punctatum]